MLKSIHTQSISILEGIPPTGQKVQFLDREALEHDGFQRVEVVKKPCNPLLRLILSSNKDSDYRFRNMNHVPSMSGL